MEVKQLSDREFDKFRQLIYEWAGIHMSEAKKALVAGRLLKRLRYYKLASYGEYLNMLLNTENKLEKQIVIDLLTTNETYFFREPKHFEYLAQVIVPQRNVNEKFRVWSAASSSGEEIYTIAMVLADGIKNGNFEIMGSDINEEVLEKARQGVYPMERTKDIPPEYLKKYCLKGVRSQEGKFLINKELRSKTKFMKINLNASLPNIGSFDVVFLRNVMIYFNKETKKAIVERILTTIKPGGYLIVGHAESLHGVTDMVTSDGPTVYKKR